MTDLETRIAVARAHEGPVCEVMGPVDEHNHEEGTVCFLCTCYGCMLPLAEGDHTPCFE